MNKNKASALAINNLQKIYASGTQALKGITFDVKEGDFFALLGPNGAGKSTTIGIISALVKKTAGTVSIFGYDIDKQHTEARKLLGLVPQEFNFNVFENVLQIVLNQAGYYGIPPQKALPKAESYLKALGLWEKRHAQAMSLSGGMKRRLMIARGLIHEPKLLILDEPTAGVDIELRRSMWEFIREINKQGTTIILTTHYLEEAENLCKNIAIIDAGEIVAHTAMRTLLDKLHMETFILYLKEPLYENPALAGFCSCLHDPTTLYVEIHKNQSVNDLYAELSQQGIDVLSMRNKTNRLEELFLNLVNQEMPVP